VRRLQVSNALVSGPEVVRSTALHAVSNNPGLQPLLPYLVQFISDEVVEQIKSSSRCVSCPYFELILVLNLC
jgi:hypothetical protein